MRRQDEIRILFPGQDPASQKFLLSDIDRFAQAFDSEGVLDFVRAQFSHGTDSVRRQAAFITSLFLPPFVSRKYGVAQDAEGLWSVFHGDGSSPSLLTRVTERSRVGQRLKSAALATLEPIAVKLARRLGSLPQELNGPAYLALSYFPFESVQRELIRSFRERGGGFSALWAFARSGGGQVSPELLVQILKAPGSIDPDLLLVATGLSPDRLIPLVAELAGRTDWLGCANLAIALSKQVGIDPSPAVEPLVRHGTGWGEVYALRALEASRRPDALRWIRRIHDQTRHIFVRQQAIRAAGGIDTDASIDFCLEQLSDESLGSHAQVLESLVRLGCPVEDLAPRARSLIKSSDLKTRVNAVLAITEPQENVFPEAFSELLRHREVLPRVEAAFCLGYWQTNASLEILTVLAESDPHSLVRVQAIKSLSKFPTGKSLPILTRRAAHAEPAEALVASRVLSRLGGENPLVVLKFLAREIGSVSDVNRRAYLLRSLGSIAGRSGRKEVEPLFAKALDSDQAPIVVGALEAWKLMDGPKGVDLGPSLGRLRERQEPSILSGVIFVSFLSGNLDALELLGDEVEGRDSARVGRAIQTLEELALHGSEVLQPENERLVAALGVTGESLGGESLPGATYWSPVDSRVQPAERLAEGEFLVSTEGSGSNLLSPLLGPDSGLQRADVKTSDSQRVDVPQERGSSKDRILAQLQNQYSQGKSKSGAKDLRKEIRRATYLLAAPAGAPSLETAPPKTRSGQRLGQLLGQVIAFFKENKVLLVPFMALAFVILVILGSSLRVVETRPPAPVPALSVVHVTGSILRDDSEDPLQSGDMVNVGQSIRVAPDARGTLVTMTGERIRVKGGGRLRVLDASTERRQITFDLEDGDFEFDFTRGGAVIVEKQEVSFGGEGVRFRIFPEGEAFKLEPMGGVLRLQDAQGAVHELEIGRIYPLATLKPG